MGCHQASDEVRSLFPVRVPLSSTVNHRMIGKRRPLLHLIELWRKIFSARYDSMVYDYRPPYVYSILRRVPHLQTE